MLLRARTYLTVAVAYGTCTMTIWLTTTCLKTLIVTLGDVLESGYAKNRVNLTRFVCARCGDEVLCGAENAVFWMCANECVWTCVKLRSHALKFKGNGPLDPLWALQCRKLGVDIFFWSSWGSNTSLLENVRERRAWPALINPTCWKKGYSCKLMWVPYYYSTSCE